MASFFIETLTSSLRALRGTAVYVAAATGDEHTSASCDTSTSTESPASTDDGFVCNCKKNNYR